MRQAPHRPTIRDITVRGRSAYSQRSTTHQPTAHIGSVDNSSSHVTTFSRLGLNGEKVTAHFRANAKANPAKLAPALTELLSWPSRWRLDDNGVILHRHLRVTNPVYISIAKETADSATQMNHHPHVAFSSLSSETAQAHPTLPDLVLTISCTTHDPPGLGMRDVKLAHKIEEIIGRHQQIEELDLEGPVSRHSDDDFSSRVMIEQVRTNEMVIRRQVSARVKKS